jgi:hypothetical protein
VAQHGSSHRFLGRSPFSPGEVEVSELAGPNLHSLEVLDHIDPPDPDDPPDLVGRDVAGVEDSVHGPERHAQLLGQRRRTQPVVAC